MQIAAGEKERERFNISLISCFKEASFKEGKIFIISFTNGDFFFTKPKIMGTEWSFSPFCRLQSIYYCARLEFKRF